MALQVLINGVDMTSMIIWKGFTWKPALSNKVDTLSFQIWKYGSRTYKPTAFDEVLFYDQGVLVFGGYILQFSESIAGVDRQMYSVACVDYTHVLDRRLVVERYEEKPVISIICDILNRYVNKGARIEIATFEATEIWQGNGAADTDNYRVGDQGRKLTSTNGSTAATYRDIRINLAPSGYSTADFIEVDVYVDDVTLLASAVMKLGDSTLTNLFSKDVTSQLATGWNIVRVARSAFTSTGSPSWSTIARIRLEVTSVNPGTVHVTFDNWQEVKTTAFKRDSANSTTNVVQWLACNYEEPSKVFGRMAQLFQLQWYVAPDKDIHFFARFDEMAPFNLTDTNGNYVYESLTVDAAADQVRNGIYVKGGDYLATAIDEDLSQQADGNNDISLLGFRYANYSLTLNGVAQAVGLDNINDFTDNEAAAQTQTGGTAVVVGDAAARTKQSQQVIVTMSGKRAKVLLRVRKQGAPVDNFQVQIFSNSGNAPSATPLSAVASLAGGSITSSFAEYTFSLTPTNPADLTLTQPTSYHIVVTRSGSNDAVNYYEIDGVTAGTYEGIANTYNGSAWSAATGAWYFYERLNFDVLYSFQDKNLKWPSAPAGGSVILWHGEPYRSLLVRYGDPTSVTKYGDYEYRINDPSIKTKEGARQRANAELLEQAEVMDDVKFETYQPGLRVGQTINVQSTIRDLDFDLIIMGLSAKARTKEAMMYTVTCSLTKSMGILYWLQQQVAKDDRDFPQDDNELFDRVDALSEIVYPSGAWEYSMLTGKVWSNDAGTTPNHGIWDGGFDHIWL